MKRIFNIITLERVLNLFELCGVYLVLICAFAFQLLLNELPCPLCLLQRLGFLCIAFGVLMNLRFGLRPSHYAICLLSALFTSFVALRQIALHVVPGTGAYGSAIFGMHFYTWSFIISILIVVATTLMLSIDRQYQKTKIKINMTHTTKILFFILFAIVILNMISIFFECGLGVCPDNPTHY